MKRLSIQFFLLLALCAGFALASCKKNQDIIPSLAYASYVSAYTGGVVSSNASIYIELVQKPEIIEVGAEVKEKLFSFSPALNGKAYWVSSNTLEFVPDSGTLKPGMLYNASFALGKIFDVEKKLSQFDFSFRVEERNFSVKINSLEVTQAALNLANVTAEIRFSDIANPDNVAGMIKATRDRESFQPVVTPTEDPRIYRFVLANIDKKDEESTLKIAVEGKTVGVDKKIEKEVTIPALKPFKLLTTELIEQPEHGVKLTFSDPVSESQDFDGLIGIVGISNYTFLAQNNEIKVFFERVSGKSELEVYVDKGLQNTSGESLGKSSDITMQLGSLDPAVKIQSTGTVMPDAEKLILQFSAVSLYAVDLSIIRIYESNVLMFLQDNSLYTSNSISGLRRSGRMVYKKLLRLDNDPTKDIHEWNDYFIDLNEIIQQEPGAIYRIEFSFKKDYAAFPCNNNMGPSSLQETNLLTKVESGDMTESDEAVWDVPQSYYYSYDYDWNEYDWEERDNPCHATYYMQDNRKAITNIMASNLGVIAKSNADNMLWVSVNNLLDTKPVADAEVTVYNFQLQQIGSMRTDANGFAVLKTKNKPFALVASSEKQKTYLRLIDGEENQLSRFDTGGKEISKGLKGFVYGERGVWRPGDTLHISFMLEDREMKIPDNHPVSIEVFNPRGQFYNKQISSNGLNGVYVFHVPTLPDDPTGLWHAYVKVGGTSFYKSLRIETVKPNRLKINLDIPGDKLVAAVNTTPMTIRSSWLTGATAQNLKTTLMMTLSRSNTQFPGYEKYEFNNPASDFESSTSEVFKGVLNDKGEVSFNMRNPKAANAPGMLRATLSCSVFEQGGDASLYNVSVPYSPFDTYVGINFNRKESSEYLETDVDNVFDVVTLNTDGKPVNSADLQYAIYKIGWSWWWEYSDESFASYLNNSSVKPVASGKVNMNNGKGTVKFRVDYPEWGRYLVYVKDNQGGHATGGTVFVDWPDWRGRSNRSDPSGIKMLAFSTDKTTYEAGETATVTIPASAGGRALVALENGTEVISREWVNVSSSGDTKYTLNISEGMAPNVYLHISLLQPHEQTVNDLPVRMYGVVPIFVTNKNSILKPQISMPDVLRPETEFTVKVKEENGRPMTYTLAVVDDGLLDLTNFKTPDPWSSFYAREALGIRTWDMYDYVMGAHAGSYGSMFSIGGDSDEGTGQQKANRFKPVVKFIGPFATRKGEEKAHKLQLPPYIGSVRVMVVAAQDAAYGKAEKTAPVRSPLMILSTLPRVVSIDEQIALPVNVFAMEDNVKNVTVKVETTGKLQLTEGNSQTINFAEPGDKMVYFALASGNATGVEKVTVTATGNGQTSTETIEIDVRNPNPPVILSDNGILNAGETGEFKYNLEGDLDENWVKLEVSRIPSVDISRRFDFIYNYPHFCSEQLTSCALPMLFIQQFKDMDDKETEAVRKNVRDAITNLYGRQLSNGGIVYWPGDVSADDWISSYAGSFLVLAKEKGYDVNEGVINRWKAYQRNLAQNWRPVEIEHKRYDYNHSELGQAYRLYTLALAGAPEMGAMNRMREIKDLSLQSRWRLAAAYAIAGKMDGANELIFNAPTDVTPYGSNNSSFGSYDRDEAMILETLILMGKDREAFTQAQKVAKNLSVEQSFTTQSTAWALVAMGRLAEKTAGSLDFGWTLNGASQAAVKSAKAVFQKDIPTNPSSGTVTISNTGNGTLYVNVVSKSKPLRDMFPAVAEGIRLEVSYMYANGTPVDVTRLKQGTDFMAVIKVSNIGSDNYTDLALTQIIPSGWEIYNERMIDPDNEDNASNAPYNYQDIRDDRVMTYFDLGIGRSKSFKIRLMASYSGSFIFPAILCEGMYDSSVIARTSAGRVVVER
ncbi:MAG: alpha-2-macroglobulin [Tannerella sp.]|jgi:uncharacterized protein YfaS (alpha-2-macroglobulin family)|nr:alpha-2-macroglobulin [Tannerella sp.]